MKKMRVSETDRGIQGEVTVASYDQMQRHLRDKGWIETEALLKMVSLPAGHWRSAMGRGIWAWSG